MPEFPHLLVASEFAPNASGGGPAVVRQMLKGWPIEKLSWWSCLPERDTRFGQQTAAFRTARIPPRLYPNQRWAAQKSWLMDTFWVPWATRHLRATLTALQPRAVWVIPHAWSIPPLARVLSRGTVPFHVTVQDYMDARNSVARLGPERSQQFVKLTERLYARATTRDATSHPMIADLRTRTGAEARQMLHAGLDQSDFDWLAQTPRESAGEIRIVYAGTILVEPVFEIFVNALNRIRHRLPNPVRLEIFSNHSYGRRGWFDATWMREGGNLAEPALTEALRAATWGFAPMALDDDDPRYNRFSFPTKFISYLAAGLPVITLGHSESSLVKLACNYGVGHCTSTGEVEKLANELLGVLSQANAKRLCRAEIIRCAMAEFDARKMRAVLHDAFRKCAEAQS